MTLNVPLDGTYTIEVDKSRMQTRALDEKTTELRLQGIRIVVCPYEANDRGMKVWTEPA